MSLSACGKEVAHRIVWSSMVSRILGRLSCEIGIFRKGPANLRTLLRMGEKFHSPAAKNDGEVEMQKKQKTKKESHQHCSVSRSNEFGAK
mmetsp:Transcript_9864/g.36782  ORF Transcript_9864/g.36782 Transcript_9864/m.36782 type:complete len:90 (-) Transcript_9864:9-278(-)